MKKGILLLSAILILSLTACSSSEKVTKAEAPSSISSATNTEAVLDSINLSQYRTGTTRTQPELINVYSDQEKLAVLGAWLKTAGTPEVFPEDKKINRINVVVYFYKVEEQPLTSDAYMLVTFEDGTSYSKLAVPPRFIEDNYPYDESVNESIISHMGTDDWRKMGDTNNIF
ncbi:hypothetical protein [Cohnella abietis]|nr:hypothetical protein [Cohnella abietis]